MEKKYDIVVFGATGFTGQFVVEEIARTIEEEKGLTWAISGRNMQKLQAVLKEASKQTGKDLEELPIIIADVKSPESLLEMAKQTRLVLNCVGPYRFFGDTVIQACIEGKSHHIDISGEPGFLENTQLKYHNKAKENSLYIVGSCGFDSIPADMGILYTKNKFDGDLNEVEGFIDLQTGPAGGKANFGTWQSAIYGFAHQSETVAIRKSLFTTQLPKPQHKLAKRRPLHYQDAVGNWCLPFLGSDRSVVNRSQRYIYEESKSRPIQFNAFLRMPSLFVSLMTAFMGVIFGIMASFSFGRTLLEKYPGLFSFGTFSFEGPTRKQIEGSSFSYTFLGRGYPTKTANPEEEHKDAPTKTIVTRVNGPEAGYISTPICMVQAGYVLLKEANKLPPKGGVYPPGAAFNKTTLIERLDKHNVKFSVVQS